MIPTKFCITPAIASHRMASFWMDARKLVVIIINWNYSKSSRKGIQIHTKQSAAHRISMKICEKHRTDDWRLRRTRRLNSKCKWASKQKREPIRSQVPTLIKTKCTKLMPLIPVDKIWMDQKWERESECKGERERRVLRIDCWEMLLLLLLLLLLP